MKILCAQFLVRNGFLYLRRKKREHYEHADRLDNLFFKLRLIRPYTDHRGKQFRCTHVNPPMCWKIVREELCKEGRCIGESLAVQESSIDNTHVSPSCHLDKLYLTELHDPKYEFFMFQQGKKVRK